MIVYEAIFLVSWYETPNVGTCSVIAVELHHMRIDWVLVDCIAYKKVINKLYVVKCKTKQKLDNEMTTQMRLHSGSERDSWTLLDAYFDAVKNILAETL